MSLQLDQHFLFEGDQDHKLVIYQLLVRLFSNTQSATKGMREWYNIGSSGRGNITNNS